MAFAFTPSYRAALSRTLPKGLHGAWLGKTNKVVNLCLSAKTVQAKSPHEFWASLLGNAQCIAYIPSPSPMSAVPKMNRTELPYKVLENPCGKVPLACQPLMLGGYFRVLRPIAKNIATETG
uniref:Uncharacterized protein n=1 Tax=Anopheles coluzzii TaxID=1518534 RepID=A0A8W7Q281_ANOCL